MNDTIIYQGQVIDAHSHLASTQFIPRKFIEGIAMNSAVRLDAMGIKSNINKIIDMLEFQLQDHDATTLISEIETSAIEHCIVLLPDFTYVMKSEITIEEMFERHCTILKNHREKFSIVAGVDPRWGKDGVSLFEKYAYNHDIAGLKLYPPCGYSPSDESLYPYYEICAQLKLPVVMHMGPTSPVLDFTFARPAHVDKAARDFPAVNFILAHGAVHHIEESVELCVYRPNIYIDTGAYLGSVTAEGWRQSLNKIFRCGINHKILYGTDWPLHRDSGGHKNVIANFISQSGPLSDVMTRDAQQIMRNTARRLFNIGLKQ